MALAAVVVLAMVALGAVPSEAQFRGAHWPRSSAAVDEGLTAAAARGPVPVIAQLSAADLPSAASASQAGARRAAVASASARVAAALPAHSYSHVQALGTEPMVAMTVDAEGLAALRAEPGVTRVSRNNVNRIQSSYTNNLTDIGAPTAWAAGDKGSGQTIAIVDTGVDGTAPFLAGKVVAEGCFSGGGPGTSMCPLGVSSSTLPGSGVPCPMLSAGCFHGTHVAGIAAGGDGGTFSGVAPSAKIIAVDVFTDLGGGQIGAYDSDVILGLQYVYGLRNSFAIASVNLSLGGPVPTGANYHCDDDPQKPAIDQLRGAGIATVAAAGNEAALDVDSPACISSAIAVGSVAAAGDVVSRFTNVSPALALFAPGESSTDVGILSSVPAGTPNITNEVVLQPCPAPYDAGTCAQVLGTSMASPHVAASIAVLRQAHPGLSVGNAVSQLEGTGAPNNQVGLTFPDLRLGSAITQVRPASLPGGVAQNKDGRFEAFMANSNGVYDKWQKSVNGGWSGWVGRGGPVRNPVIAATDLDGRLEVFGTSSSGVLYHAWQKTPGGSWSGWASLGGSISGNHFTVLMNSDGHLEVVAVTTTNVIEHIWQSSPGGSWGSWHSFGVSVPGVRGITSIRLPDGEGFTAMITGKGELIVDVQDELFGAWDQWAILNPPAGNPSPVMVGNPVLGVDLDNRLEIMAADTGGRVWSYYESYAQALDIFTHRARIISGGVTSGRLAVGHDDDGRLELFDARPGGSIIDMWQKSPGSSWGGPSVLSSSAGEIPSPIQAMSTVDGRIELFSAQGSDHDWQVQANGPWSGWRPF